MSAEALLAAWARPARRRAVTDAVAIGTPAVVAVAALAWRWQGASMALAAALAGLALVATAAALATRRFDRRWLVRALDPRLEDSAGLLLLPPATLAPLQRLQRARVEARLAAALPDLARTAPRAPRHPRTIALAWLAGFAVTGLALAWPAARPGDAAPPGTAATQPGPPRLVAQALTITPPAYTGAPRRRLAGLDARAPEGARLDWRLRFTTPPASVDLVALDGRRFAFSRAPAGNDWTLARRLDRSLLYRIVAAGSRDPALARLHRIDDVADTAPVIRVVAPARTLTTMAPGQRRWRLAFEASDDHGLAPTARLRLIVTSGEVENIAAAETALVLTGTGTGTATASPRRRRFAATLDPAALGLTPGNDLVAQLTVSDRAPVPHRVQSPSLILRRPPERGPETTGLDLAVKTVMPAYFRSQRQIIIDIEKLLRERRRLAPDRFAARADAIGEDQRILRLRYGQFLGEEASDAPALPTNDAPAPASTPAPAAAPALPTGHTAGDGHDHPPPPRPAGFGDPGSVLADYGHAHGDDDAATLADPVARTALAQALDAMWSSERALRQATPADALPHAYAALRLIKQVQQATRIYLARTGLALPPLDFTRRLAGDRKGLAALGRAAPPAAVPRDAAPAAAWRALAAPGPVAPATLDRLERWLATAPRLADPLALAAAIDAVRRDPAAATSRRTLSAQLWRAVPPPPARVTRRAAGDAAGDRYLGIRQ